MRNERQSLPIPILPRFSLIAVHYGSQNVHPLGLLPASEATADTLTWVDDVSVAGKTKKLVIAGLLDRSTPSNFEPLCIVKKSEQLKDGDVVLPLSFPPVMSSEGFLNEHNSKLITAGKASKYLSSRHCLAFTSDNDPTPNSSFQLNHVPHTGYEPTTQLNYQPEITTSPYASHDDSPIWTYDEEYNEIPINNPQVAPQAEEKLPPPTFGFPSPPGYQLSLVNPSVYKSYGPSSNFHLIGLLPRSELHFLNGFLEVPKVDFSPDKQYGDLEAVDSFQKIWTDHSLVVRVNNAQPVPSSFKFVILFRADHAGKLKALNATVWPIHVQLDGQHTTADYQLAHIPKLTYGSHDLLDSLFLLLTAIPERSVVPPADLESKSNALRLEYEMPAYPGIQSPDSQDAGPEMNSTSLKTDILESVNNKTSTTQQALSTVQRQDDVNADSNNPLTHSKPLPSKKSWKNRVSQPMSTRSQTSSEINRVAREILAFLGTNL